MLKSQTPRTFCDRKPFRFWWEADILAGTLAGICTPSRAPRHLLNCEENFGFCAMTWCVRSCKGGMKNLGASWTTRSSMCRNTLNVIIVVSYRTEMQHREIDWLGYCLSRVLEPILRLLVWWIVANNVQENRHLFFKRKELWYRFYLDSQKLVAYE